MSLPVLCSTGVFGRWKSVVFARLKFSVFWRLQSVRSLMQVELRANLWSFNFLSFSMLARRLGLNDNAFSSEGNTPTNSRSSSALSSSRLFNASTRCFCLRLSCFSSSSSAILCCSIASRSFWIFVCRFLSLASKNIRSSQSPRCSSGMAARISASISSPSQYSSKSTIAWALAIPCL